MNNPNKFLPIVEFLTKAGETLKYPKLELDADDHHAVSLRLSLGKATFPGSIAVTDGRRYPDNVYYGRISPEGVYHQSTRARLGSADVIYRFLVTLADDPQGVVAAFGHKTGACCLCGRKLEDERSTEVGYGPVCAKSWGLPWGKVTATPAPASTTSHHVAPAGTSSLADLAAQLIGGGKPDDSPAPSPAPIPAEPIPAGLDLDTAVPAGWTGRFIN